MSMQLSGSVRIKTKERLEEFTSRLIAKEISFSVENCSFDSLVMFSREINQENYNDFIDLIRSEKEASEYFAKNYFAAFTGELNEMV